MPVLVTYQFRENHNLRRTPLKDPLNAKWEISGSEQLENAYRLFAVLGLQGID